ncbi:glycoside hydrolase family 3 N-terminal domain-containing protein [Blautia sp. Marseille-P3201T]|uniref:glycoside hydrolase family 3 N-terminal domain-containing protein n=1 Tax=Blautia sp. Marseille-P3201T TaxID=1907659 RepID=UPI00093206A1|nr:glycoside hydrolase family 3 N-terminal domain-containing protein [Blautia sp. Marseille-P3201T]
MEKNTYSTKAKELLAEMTLQEKIGQLNQKLYGFGIYERDGEEISFSQEFKDEVEKYGGLGTLYGLYRADPWSQKDYENGLYGENAVKAYNQMQKYVLEHSRLKIPALLSTECPHGHQALDSYLLPVNLNMGATFHPELIHSAYRVCGKQLHDMGVDLALISLLDVVRDPRWGRSEECFSEDPYLCSRMAEQVVSAVQGEGVSVVAKHFAAQGECTGGINASAARIGERELREIHLPAMKACADAGVDGVMAAYNEIDGVFCHANYHLLTDILRDEMGFDGVVMADGCAIDQLNVVTGDCVRSGAAALRAGVDIGLWDEAYGHLDEAFEKGYITEEDIDRAVLRVLELKVKRGLFESPLLDENQKPEEYSYEKYPQALQIARESVVLLENRNDILPLSKETRKIAVIGPNADAVYNQLGDYSPQVKRENCSTVLDGVRSYLGDKAVYARGCGVFDGTQEELEEAVKLAEQSDITILVLGGSSSRFGEVSFDANGAAISEHGVSMDCGEGVDTAELSLPAVQRELAEKIFATGSKVITVIIGGRAYALDEVAEKSDAVLYGFYPGMQGGKAIGEILFGEVNPSGRLPVSLPRCTGQLPVYYNYKNSYRSMHYYNIPDGAAYTFGYGKSYTNFEYEDISFGKKDVAIEELHKNGIQVEMSIKNIGEQDGYAVPLVYIAGEQGSVVRRAKELKGFQKIWLKKGESKKVSIFLPSEAFAVWNSEMKFTVEPGRVQIILEEMGQTVGSETLNLF